MADVERIVGYRVDREISRSSIASVYQGFQESLQREVLIKRLHPQFVRDDEIRARFEREAHALARIKHKNIVHIYDYRADDENMVLVQEWIGGGSVAEYMRQHGPLTEPEAIALVVDVLEGLDIAHKSKVIHRDIKPSNLMLSQRGSIKITDFGLAQFEGAASLTQQGAIMGTPAYMAPEMVNGQPGNTLCDLYSVGVTLYEVLTGENPFQADHISQTLQRVLSVKPGKLEGVHDETNRLLATLMAKDPNQRPASAGDVLDMIMPLAKEMGMDKGWESVARTSVTIPGGEEGDPVRATTTTHSIRPAKKASPPLATVYVAAALMVITVAVVWFFLARPFDEGSSPLPGQTDSMLADAGTEQETVPDEGELIPADSAADVSGQTGSDDTPPANADDGQQDAAATEQQPPADLADDDTSGEPASSEPAQQDPGNADRQAEPSGGERNGDSGDNAGPVDGPATDAANDGENPENTPVAPPQGNTAGPDSGYVMLSVQPWAHIYHNDLEVGTTPLVRPMHLAAGRLEFDLINPQFPPVTHEVLVPAGNDTMSVTVDLYSKVGVIEFIDAVPWAEVSLDGEYIGRTPIGQSIFVQPGEHTLTFRHPTLRTHDETFTATAGGEPLRIRVNLYE